MLFFVFFPSFDCDDSSPLPPKRVKPPAAQQWEYSCVSLVTDGAPLLPRESFFRGQRAAILQVALAFQSVAPLCCQDALSSLL